jgi:putative peptide zinc metalloprotease protein
MLVAPKLAPGCSFHVFDNGGGNEEYVLASADGRQFKVSALAHRILARLDGETTLDQIADELADDSIPVTPDQLRSLLEEKYLRLGVIEDATAPPGSSRTVVRRRPGFPMLLALPLVPERAVGALSRWLQYLFLPALALPLLAAIVGAHVLVYSTEHEVRSLGPESYLWITLLCLLSILVHELGHAAAVRRFGGAPGTIGWGLYLLLPTFFADVSQLWRFPRRHRMVVDLGGAYFQLLVFAVYAVLAVRTGSQELLATCHLIDVMVLMALNPLFHFDGYWFLADYLALPKLQTTAFRAVGRTFRRLTGRPAEALDLPPMGRLARTLFWSYSALASVFLVAVVWLIYRYLSSVVLTLPVVAPQAFAAVAEAFRSGQPVELVVRLMTAFFLVAFPATAVVGLVLYALRLARVCAERLRRRARNVPQGG